MVPCLSSSLQQHHFHLSRPAAPTTSHPRKLLNRKFRHNPRSASKPARTAPSEAVLVHDGLVVPAPATAQLLLAQHRDWSYTAAAVRKQHLVVDWELHVERLIRNLNVLAQQRPPAHAEFVMWQQQQGSQEAVAAAMQQLINPMVATALHELQHSTAEPDLRQAMLTVALGDKTGAAPERRPSSVTGGAPPLSVKVWAKPGGPAPLQAAKVLVAGDPRPAAQAKHADWVVARQPLQQLQQQAGVDEVVLSDSSGALLEGLVSSFFVVADAAQMAALGQPLTAASVYPGGGSGQDNATQQQQHKQQEGSKQLTGLVLMTTGPAADALLGITQQRVVQACQQLKLPVVLQPAKSCTAGAWREAFLSSCWRGLAPVQEIRLHDGRVWGAGAAESAGGPGGAVVAQLQQAVTRLQTEFDSHEWLL